MQVFALAIPQTQTIKVGGETVVGLSLVALDTNHIKGYVFATDKLKEIRGASSILDRLNRRAMRKLALSEDPEAIEIYANTTVALLSAEEEVSPPGRAATSGELAEPLPPVLTPPWSTPGWVPDVGCSCGCGSVDGRARPLWGRATHDEP
jgi:hypothetical protein